VYYNSKMLTYDIFGLIQLNVRHSLHTVYGDSEQLVITLQQAVATFYIFRSHWLGGGWEL